MGELRLREGVTEWREAEGQLLVLDLEASDYLVVNRTGAAIWPALVAGTTREELIKLLTSTFDVDAESAAADLDEFLSTLRKRGLLEPGERA
jgi:Coenzyme PQQ synthesis protein D (PqqD)